jgi:hypothetical protein
MIKIKSKFYGWREIDFVQALDWAKYMLRAITTCKTDNERVEIINNRLNGIKFELRDLI